MYKSPINVVYGKMRTTIENDIIKAVQDVGIDVDKEELIRALEYDRNQYDAGYADGYADGKREAVAHGRWVEVGDDFAGKHIYCSNCHEDFILGRSVSVEDMRKRQKFCFNCGAKMDLGVE